LLKRALDQPVRCRGGRVGTQHRSYLWIRQCAAEPV